jgi:membrane protease YdiL (CAAX protease family)
MRTARRGPEDPGMTSTLPLPGPPAPHERSSTADRPSSTADRPSATFSAPTPQPAVPTPQPAAPTPQTTAPSLATASASPTPRTADPSASPTALAFHRLPRALAHRSRWWRPLVTLAVAGAVLLAMGVQLILLVVAIGALVPGAAPSAEMTDPLNPIDNLFGLGLLALLIPAVLVGTLAGHGRAGIAHSVRGRFRWGLAGRAALAVVPLYLVVNVGLNLWLGREGIVVPPLTASVALAWLIMLVLVPLQAAGEEYAFRVLPLQALGTWVRSPLPGILLPVPLFVLGHGYTGLGKVDIAMFAILMGALAWKSGGIELPVLLHVANNWTLFLIAPLVPGSLEQGEVTLLVYLLSSVPPLLCTAGLWWWVSRREGVGLWEPVRGTAPLGDRRGTLRRARRARP